MLMVRNGDSLQRFVFKLSKNCEKFNVIIVNRDREIDRHNVYITNLYFVVFRILDLSQHNVWSRSVQVMEQISSSDEDSTADCSHLSALNLAHNQFTAVPTVLSCLAVNLTRLNMAYNRYSCVSMNITVLVKSE